MYAIYGGGDLAGSACAISSCRRSRSSVVATGVIARLTRAAMLEVLRQDFIRTARAKGLHERKVIYRHAFRAALVSVIPVLGHPGRLRARRRGLYRDGVPVAAASARCW